MYKVPDYNRDGDNYYFTPKELEAFLADHHNQIKRELKKKWPKNKYLKNRPVEIDMAYNKALSEAWEIVEEVIKEKPMQR